MSELVQTLPYEIRQLIAQFMKAEKSHYRLCQIADGAVDAEEILVQAALPGIKYQNERSRTHEPGPDSPGELEWRERQGRLPADRRRKIEQHAASVKIPGNVFGMLAAQSQLARQIAFCYADENERSAVYGTECCERLFRILSLLMSEFVLACKNAVQLLRSKHRKHMLMYNKREVSYTPDSVKMDVWYLECTIADLQRVLDAAKKEIEIVRCLGLIRKETRKRRDREGL